MKQLISSGATVVLVGCAIIITALAVRNELYSESSPQPAQLPSGADSLTLFRMGVGDQRIHVFTDYLCRYCKEQEAIIESLLANPTRSTEVHYHPFPLDTVLGSPGFEAAAFVHCAEGARERAHQTLFGHTSLVRMAAWDSLAMLMGDELPPTFMDCIGAEGTRRWLLNARAIGSRIGVRSTPSILFDGVLMRGVQRVEYLDSVLQMSAR